MRGCPFVSILEGFLWVDILWQAGQPGILGYPAPGHTLFVDQQQRFPRWGAVELGAVQETGMRCHFWVNGGNSPPLAYTTAYTSPPFPCTGLQCKRIVHPWPTSNPTLRDKRPAMVGGRRTGERSLWEESN